MLGERYGDIHGAVSNDAMATLTITIGDFKVNVDWLREYDAATPWLDETDRLGFDDGEGELPPFPDESEDEELRAHIGAWAMRAQLPHLRRWHPELCPCDLCLPTRAHGRSLSEVERAMHPSDALAIVNPYRKLGEIPKIRRTWCFRHAARRR